MPPPSSSRLGASPSDPTEPESRTFTLGGAPGAANPPPQPAARAVGRARYADGLLVGAAAAALAGGAWWAVSTTTEWARWPLLGVGVGIVTALGVLVGARRGGPVQGLMAFVLTALSIAAAVYFIDRSLTISAVEETGRFVDIPLWQGFSFVGDLYESWWDVERADVWTWVGAAVLALAIAGLARTRAPDA